MIFNVLFLRIKNLYMCSEQILFCNNHVLHLLEKKARKDQVLRKCDKNISYIL